MSTDKDSLWVKLGVVKGEENSDKNEKTKSETIKPVNTFPQNNNVQTSFPTTQPPTQSSFTSIPQSNVPPEPFLSKFLEIYDKNFATLNQPGYDFYEFFQGIIGAGMDGNNKLAYTMAFNIGKQLEPSLSKEKLLTQSDFYITEINKFFSQNADTGINKKKNFITDKNNESQSLTNDIGNLKLQLEEISRQITEKESLLSKIDEKYFPMINESDNKLFANEFAKNKLVNAIEIVKTGINTNL